MNNWDPQGKSCGSGRFGGGFRVRVVVEVRVGVGFRVRVGVGFSV